MDKFEFVFALIALLLGLALTEIAGGIASALKARHRIRIGWLTPLAALLICLDIASAWPSIWALRNAFEVRTLPLIVATLMCLGYYIAASFVFPDTFEDGMSLDDWYFENRWFSIGGTIVLAFMFALASSIALHERVSSGVGELIERNWRWSIYITLFAVALLARRRWLVITAFVSVLALYFVIFGLLG